MRQRENRVDFESCYWQEESPKKPGLKVAQTRIFQKT